MDSILLGGDNYASARAMARMTGDLLRASHRIDSWPHTALLLEYDRIGDRLWEPDVFRQTSYCQNGLLNIESFAHYHGAVTEEDLLASARGYVAQCKGLSSPPRTRHGRSEPVHAISVRPVAYSNLYQVIDGHHRLAIAFMNGQSHVTCEVFGPPQTTPVQDLLLDVFWQMGKRQLYQPVDVPEVRSWPVVRHCTDRLAKMIAFLGARGPSSLGSSYLDVGCSYGWFVAEMAKAGFRATGVDRDPAAVQVGQFVYGNTEGQVACRDCLTFLRELRGSGTKFDVVSCFSLLHHYIMNRCNVPAEEMLQLLDAITGQVLFFDMGESGDKFFEGKVYEGWDADRIEQWLRSNSSFADVIRLGTDEDRVPPFQNSYKRMLFACVR
ncbi:MAG TPA: methyltransferase domain-containing protein [Acidobacteriaceae bacterium]